LALAGTILASVDVEAIGVIDPLVIDAGALEAATPIIAARAACGSAVPLGETPIEDDITGDCVARLGAGRQTQAGEQD